MDPFEYYTLLLTSSMIPHRIVGWQISVTKLFEGEIEALENHNVTVSSPSTTFYIPSVARIKKSIPLSKKGVKFSRENVYSRDGYQCLYCGGRFPKRQLNYDHVIPRNQGGKTVWKNIATSCYSCNSRKGGRTPEQAGMRLLKTPERPYQLPLMMPPASISRAPEEWRFYLQGLPYVELAFE